jgi:hypothetical protein
MCGSGRNRPAQMCPQTGSRRRRCPMTWPSRERRTEDVEHFSAAGSEHEWSGHAATPWVFHRDTHHALPYRHLAAGQADWNEWDPLLPRATFPQRRPRLPASPAAPRRVRAAEAARGPVSTLPQCTTCQCLAWRANKTNGRIIEGIGRGCLVRILLRVIRRSIPTQTPL